MPDIAPGFGIAITKQSALNLIRVALNVDIGEIAAAGRLYATTAAGIAATTNGQYFFLAVSGADSFPLYKNVAGVATDQGIAMPSTVGLENLADDIEAAAAVLGGDASLGDFPTKTGDGSALAWVNRSDLSRQPSVATDLTTGSTYQILGSYASPATRFSSAVVGDELRITTILDNTFPVGVGVPIRVEMGRAYVVRGRCISVTGGSFNEAGIYIGLTPIEPVPGAAVAEHDAASNIILARGDGVIAVYDYRTVSEAAGVDETPGGTGQAFTDESVTEIFALTSPTTGRVYVYVDGSFSAYKDLDDLPEDCWLVGGIRTAGAGSVHAIEAVEVHGTSLDVIKRIYLDENADAGGDGSELAPFTTSEEVNQAIALDVQRKSLKIDIRAGTYTPIRLYPSRYEEIEITAARGEQVTIDCAELLAPGGWTQIGASNVWHRPNRYLDNSTDYSGVVDVTAGVTQVFGRTSSLTVDHALYERLPVNTASNHASFTAGRYSVHTAGTYAGEILIRCYGDANPNTKSWKRSLWADGLSCVAEEGATNVCRVTVTGIDVVYPFSTGFNFGRCIVDISDCSADYCMTGSGFEFNYCEGVTRNLRTNVTYADGIHGSGDGGAPDRLARMIHFEPVVQAAAHFALSVGDGISPHANHRWTIIGGAAIACGKDGISTNEGVTARDFRAIDNWGSGISVAPITGTGHDLNDTEVSGCILSGNDIGLVLSSAALNNIAGTIEVWNSHFHANATNSIRVFGTGTGLDLTVNARGCMTSGAAPSGGHKSGSTINVLGVALT